MTDSQNYDVNPSVKTANLDEKILCGKMTHHLDPTIRKLPVTDLCGNRGFHIPFWSMIYMALKFTLPACEMEFEFQ